MKARRLIYLLALASVSLTLQHKKVTRSSKQLETLNSDYEDSELMQLEASGSKNKKKDKMEQEKVKTLSQQVADGKYGLIQKELFNKPPKRPGILSYESNSEVPNDTINNLGGLDKNEIWLAENHLLVLKGGNFPPYEDKKEHTDSLWPPLDNYKAPLHQVKIPPNPKVPPPFPVQLTKDGPLQILGTNFSRTLNETDKSTPYTVSSPDLPSGQKIPTTYPNSSNPSPGTVTLPIPIINPGEFTPGVSFPPSNLNETWPPFLGYLPPGAVILPPPGNQTDLYDDDDPSIYYPPPYSFFYPQDNSSAVPPGPLVPGIILPPPPDFFSLLGEKTSTIRNLPTQRFRKPTTNKPKVQISNITHLSTTVDSNEVTTEKPFRVYPVKNIHTTKITTENSEIISNMKGRNRTYLPTKTNKPHFIRKNPQNITILRPVKSKSTQPPKIYLLPNEISQRPSTKKHPIVSSTQIPLKYYTTTNDISTYSVNQVSNKNKYNTQENKTTLKPAQYYFYEEPDLKFITTLKTPTLQNNNHGATEEFFIPPKANPPVRQRKPQYIYVTGRPYNTQKPKFRFIQQPVKPDTFRVHITKLQNQIRHYYTTERTTKKPSPKPVYQYSFQAANYQSQNHFKPSILSDSDSNQFKTVTTLPPKYSVQIQQAIEIFPTESPKYHESEQIYYQNNEETTKNPKNYFTTPKTNYYYKDVTQNPPYYDHATTSRPILQYSFEATQNPVYQGFYTKPDEGFFDENTREYFTVFGKKLVSSTTPLPGFVPLVTESYSIPNEQSSVYQKRPNYHQKPISLGSDTIVNYVHPKPNLEPEAEHVQFRTQNAEHVQFRTQNAEHSYSNVVKYSPSITQYNPSKLNRQEPEIIKAIELPVATKDTQDGSYISYELPGDDGAHFYFLTPQFAQNKENSRLYYSKPNSKRIRRDEIKNDKER